MTEKNERVKGKIETIAFGGEGILRDQGLVVFVPFTAPGDTATIELFAKKKNFAKGKLIFLEDPSPMRTEPKCPYFGLCGGCQLQHLNYSAQIAVKQTFVRDALKRIGKIEVADITVVPSKLKWHYRRHIRLKLKKDGGGFAAGYTGCDNISFLPIAECSIFLPSNHTLFLSLKPLLSSLQNEGIDEGSLRIIKTDDDKFLLVFAFNADIPKNSSICEKALADHREWQGIIMHSPKQQMQWGETDCKAELLGLKAYFSPLGFVQNHPEQSLNLYQAILDSLPQNSEKILDLYCGIGLTSLLFARAGKTVIGVEAHVETIKLAKENASANHLSIEFFAGSAESLGVQLLKTRRPDVVLCNPPRTGLDDALVQVLIEEKPPSLLYVSCMPSTLARDLQKLIQGGYQIDQIRGFDMFPQTTHVETLVSLKLLTRHSNG